MSCLSSAFDGQYVLPRPCLPQPSCPCIGRTEKVPLMRGTFLAAAAGMQPGLNYSGKAQRPESCLHGGLGSWLVDSPYSWTKRRYFAEKNESLHPKSTVHAACWSTRLAYGSTVDTVRLVDSPAASKQQQAGQASPAAQQARLQEGKGCLGQVDK